MAKFGIALGSGPRGLGFESRYSDQKKKGASAPFFLLVCIRIRKDCTSGYTGAKNLSVCPTSKSLLTIPRTYTIISIVHKYPLMHQAFACFDVYLHIKGYFL